MARIPSPRNSSPSPSLRSSTSRANDRSAMEASGPASVRSSEAGRSDTYETFQLVLQRRTKKGANAISDKTASGRDAARAEGPRCLTNGGGNAQKKSRERSLSRSCFRLKVSSLTALLAERDDTVWLGHKGRVEYVQRHAAPGSCGRRRSHLGAACAAALRRRGRREHAQHCLQRQPAVLRPRCRALLGQSHHPGDLPVDIRSICRPEARPVVRARPADRLGLERRQEQSLDGCEAERRLA